MSIAAIINDAKAKVESLKSDADKSNNKNYSDSLTNAAKILSFYITCAEKGVPNCIKHLCGIMGVEVPKKKVGPLQRSIDSAINNALPEKNNEEITDTDDNDPPENDGGSIGRHGF